MKLSEKIRAETKYSVYLKWADKAEQLEAALDDKTKQFRAFREARIGHDYITHNEELKAENEGLKAGISDALSAELPIVKRMCTDWDMGEARRLLESLLTEKDK